MSIDTEEVVVLAKVFKIRVVVVDRVYPDVSERILHNALV